MVTCCAIGCSNSSLKGKFKLYRLPMGKHDKDRLKIWLERIGRDKWIPTNHSRLCEIHFAEDQFESKRADNRRLLKYNAIPSIFIHPRKLKEKPKVIKKEYNFDLEVEPHLRMTPVTSLDWIVQIEPTTFISPDIESSEILGPDTSMVEEDTSEILGPDIVPSIEPGTSIAEQEIRKAMTCENYPADNPQPDFPIKIKEEPLDPDAYEQDILSVSVKQEPDDSSEESSLTSNQGSLFQPPVLIKEEPISSEEES